MTSSSKRTHAASDETSSDEPAPKRSKHQNSKKRAHQSSHIDPTWGQKYVFSNQGNDTSVPFDSDIECEDDSDAMAYLKSVRLEAASIPHLLVAPRVQIGPQLPKGFLLPNKAEQDDEQGQDEYGEQQDDGRGGAEEGASLDRSIYSLGQGDYRGRYEDGAYVAQPDDWDVQRTRRGRRGGKDRERGDHDYGYDEADGSQDMYDDDYNANDYYHDKDVDAESNDHHQATAALHKAYFASLTTQYLSFRALLQSTPPPAVVAALPRTHGYNVDHFGPRTSVFAVWNQRLRNTDPLPAQVCSMDREAVLRVLRVLLSGKFLRRGCELRERTSRWVWALLARLPDRGEMNHVEIGWVRDLGRRAVLMSRSLVDMANLREALEGEGEGEGLGVHEGVDGSEDDDNEEGEVPGDVGEDGEDDGDEGPGEDGVEEAGKAEGQMGKGQRQPSRHVEQKPSVPETTNPPLTKPAEEEAGDGQINDHGDADQKSEPMGCSEDGEVAEDAATTLPASGVSSTPQGESLEAARARILARLDNDDVDHPVKNPVKTEVEQTEEDESGSYDPVDAQLRARINMRATLNMILTVVGEYYGQRDLLEFREPFTGM